MRMLKGVSGSGSLSPRFPVPCLALGRAWSALVFQYFGFRAEDPDLGTQRAALASPSLAVAPFTLDGPAGLLGA